MKSSKQVETLNSETLKSMSLKTEETKTETIKTEAFKMNTRIRRIKKMYTRSTNGFLDKYWYYLLAFLIPFAAVLIAYIGMGIYPFGERGVTVIDSYHQYAPFFSEFYNKITSGENLFYSWNGGMGINFWSIVVYYLSSPLNVIVLLFPRENLLEAFALIIMLKIALSGVSFSYYIHKHYRKKDLSIVYFSSFYALSGWVLGYNWNIMWIDCIVLFPLIMLGLERLVREGRGIFYAVTLGLSIFFNYYISIMICIFLVIDFFVLFFQKRTRTWRLFVKRFFAFAGYSLLAGGLAAVMLLPEMYTLMQTNSAESSFPTTIKFYNSFLDILGQQLSFNEPTDLSGLPNLFCGVIVIMCVVLYIFRKKTPLRYKISRLLLLVFLIFSCNVNVLDYIWHGFHYPNSLPNRFTFIYIFLLLTIAYEVVISINQYTFWQLLTGFIASMALILSIYYFGEEGREMYVYYISMGLLWVYLILMCLYKISYEKKKLIGGILCAILALEAGGNGVYGLIQNGSINRTSYNSKLEAAGKVRDAIGDEGEDGLQRTELDYFNGRNNAMWLGFKSVSMFSSTLSDGLDTLMDHLGFFAAVNKFSYEGSTRLTDAIFGIKYLMSEDQKDSIRAFNYVGEYEGQYLYENDEALPMAFMVNRDYENWNPDSIYPWENLNSFVNCATDVQENLFDIEYMVGEPTAVGGTAEKQDEYTYHFIEDGSESTATLEYTYTPTYQKERYIYYEAPHMERLKVTINGESRTYFDTRGHIVDLGEIGPEDTVVLTLTLDSDYSSADVMVAMFGLNEDIYEEVWGQLSQNTLDIVDYSENSLRGTIEVSEDGIMYTSIPYDSGWTIRVDGEKVETKSLNDSLMYIELSAGTHEVEMTFMPSGFKAGFAISFVCLFILIVIAMRKNKCSNSVQTVQTKSIADQKQPAAEA